MRLCKRSVLSCDQSPVAKNSVLILSWLLAIVSCCQAYLVRKSVQCHQRTSFVRPGQEERSVLVLRPTLPQSLYSRHEPTLLFSSSSSTSPASLREREITQLCEARQFDEAMANVENELPESDLKSCYQIILKSLVDQQQHIHKEWIEQRNTPTNSLSNDDYLFHIHLADKIVGRLFELGESEKNLLPTAEDFNDVIKMWGSSTFADEASMRCQSYLESLWSLHRKYKKERFVPHYESYLHTVMACSARDRGVDAARRAQELMKEMESICHDYPQLTPNRQIANGVLIAWSNSGKKYRGDKCERILDRMIRRAMREEDDDNAPDTKSFNIVLNALAQGMGQNSEARAESLLERMEDLSSKIVPESGSYILDCAPDEISFNTVLNCWAMSRRQGAADRATAILDHMKKRHEAGLTDVAPAWSTYSTVLKAWARSRDPDAINRAEAVFSEYWEACESGRPGFSYNAFAINSMINCYAKSKHPDAGKRSFELFETMKANMGKPGWEKCFVDIYSYTSLIDAISKEQSYEASEKAISLLEEVEQSFAKTGDTRFQPNIRLYTSVVNAIGRSHKYPDRAKAIVDRVESSYLEGLSGKESQPDVWFYNALINAYGWSDVEERSQESFEILKRMISLFKSKRLVDAKPDTVSFNSVLNAFAHEETQDSSRRDSIMKNVVEAFELLNASPEYGKPDQRTYVQVLASIAKHMAEHDEKRALMAEATFLQCASNGLVGPKVIIQLYSAIEHSRFRALMGPASTGKDKLIFDVSKLPAEWTVNVSTPNFRGRRARRSRSRRRQGSSQITKDIMTSSAQNKNNRNNHLRS